jgi:two-component system chemotaxis response regulator CheB
MSLPTPHLPTAHPPRIVVMGASAGGIAALETLVGCLPANFPAAILLVVHVAADSPGMLPNIMSRAGKLPAAFASEGEVPLPGRIYIAPPTITWCWR